MSAVIDYKEATRLLWPEAYPNSRRHSIQGHPIQPETIQRFNDTVRAVSPSGMQIQDDQVATLARKVVQSEQATLLRRTARLWSQPLVLLRAMNDDEELDISYATQEQLHTLLAWKPEKEAPLPPVAMCFRDINEALMVTAAWDTIQPLLSHYADNLSQRWSPHHHRSNFDPWHDSFTSGWHQSTQGLFHTR